MFISPPLNQDLCRCQQLHCLFNTSALNFHQMEMEFAASAQFLQISPHIVPLSLIGMWQRGANDIHRHDASGVVSGLPDSLSHGVPVQLCQRSHVAADDLKEGVKGGTPGKALCSCQPICCCYCQVAQPQFPCIACIVENRCFLYQLYAFCMQQPVSCCYCHVTQPQLPCIACLVGKQSLACVDAPRCT